MISLCKNCFYFRKGECLAIEKDDMDYPHNNKFLAGIHYSVLDDSGLDINLRVSENFGCKLFKEK